MELICQADFGEFENWLFFLYFSQILQGWKISHWSVFTPSRKKLWPRIFFWDSSLAKRPNSEKYLQKHWFKRLDFSECLSPPLVQKSGKINEKCRKAMSIKQAFELTQKGLFQLIELEEGKSLSIQLWNRKKFNSTKISKLFSKSFPNSKKRKWLPPKLKSNESIYSPCQAK